MKIESPHNPKIRELERLIRKSRHRKEKNCFAVEGVQENQYALQSGFKLIQLYIQKSFCSHTDLFDAYEDKQIELSATAYNKVAYRADSQGVIGVYQFKNTRFEDTLTQPTTCTLVLDGIEKPGNIGAIARTAYAAGINAMVLVNQKSDPYHPNAIRSSVGAILKLSVFTLSQEEALETFQNQNIKIYVSLLEPSAKSLFDIQFPEKIAMIFGNEHEGVNSFWLNSPVEKFYIPMTGELDSLNVSNASAISTYEWFRQKSIKNHL